MEISWLKPLCESWHSGDSQGRQHHALMLSGPLGIGKRSAAAWLVGRFLGKGQTSELPTFPMRVPEHADLHWITRLTDPQTRKLRQSIGVDQIRELVAEMSLTSYEGGGKAAVIEPADLMTEAAANSLLKTLEEPPGASLLVLVADRHGRLPATIYSRCQRLTLRPPPEEEAVLWLNRWQPAPDWPRFLAAAGMAPLAAIALREQADAISAMAADFRAIAEGRAQPLPVAARWAGMDPEFVLAWLARQVQHCIRRTAGISSGNAGELPSESVLSRMDSRNLFCYLDGINRLRRQGAGSFNVQLSIECLLIDWSQGLHSVSRPW